MSGERTSFDSADADALVAQLQTDPSRFSERGLANALIAQFWKGYPIAYLRPLLHSDNADIVKTAVWIASELPHHAVELLDDAIALLEHPDRRVRYYALDIILLGARDGRAGSAVHIAKAIDDREDAAASSAIFLLSRATPDQIAASIAGLVDEEPDSPHLAGLRMLVESNSADVATAIRCKDSLSRRYGLAAAERAYDRFPELLELAKTSDDRVVSQSADHLLKQHEIRRS